MIRLAHCADIHFSERLLLAGELVLEPETGINVRLSDVERCMSVFAERAREFGAELVIIAGDVYNRPKPSPNEERAAIRAIDSLAAQAPVLIIPGNHDHNGSPTEATAVTSLTKRANVFVAERPGFFDLLSKTHCPLRWTALEDAATADELVRARIFVLPWPSRSALMEDEATAGLTAEEMNARVSGRLATIVAALRALRVDGVPNVLVFHGTISEATINEQPAALQQDIGLRVADMAGFGYVALGHIHQRQSFALDGGGEAWYPGSIERFAFGEEKETKGANLVEVSAGVPPQVTFCATPARPYRTHSVAAALAGPIEDDGRTVHRVKGDVSQAGLGEVRGRLSTAPPRHLRLDLTVERQLKIRDPGMREVLSEEALLRRRLEARGIRPEKIQEYVMLHAKIASGV